VREGSAATVLGARRQAGGHFSGDPVKAEEVIKLLDIHLIPVCSRSIEPRNTVSIGKMDERGAEKTDSLLCFSPQHERSARDKTQLVVFY
jgi:hypothetical protein